MLVYLRISDQGIFERREQGIQAEKSKQIDYVPRNLDWFREGRLLCSDGTAN